MLTMYELTQMAFAKGEETVLEIRRQADAVSTAIEASFSEDGNKVFNDLWDNLMSRVNYPQELTEEDYIEHNQRAAEQFVNRKME